MSRPFCAFVFRYNPDPAQRRGLSLRLCLSHGLSAWSPPPFAVRSAPPFLVIPHPSIRAKRGWVRDPLLLFSPTLIISRQPKPAWRSLCRSRLSAATRSRGATAPSSRGAFTASLCRPGAASLRDIFKGIGFRVCVATPVFRQGTASAVEVLPVRGSQNCVRDKVFRGSRLSAASLCRHCAANRHDIFKEIGFQSLCL